MNLSEIIAAARIQATDTVAPYLWSDTEITGYANDAEREACRRARLITDSTTAAVCSITLSTAVSYPLDPKVLFINRVKLVGESIPLAPISYKDLDRQVPGWEDNTGTPTHFVKDTDTGRFRPYPTPTVAGTAKLTVTRMPLEDMVTSHDEPEIRPHLHDSLLFWVLYRMFSKPDNDGHDEVKAAKNLGLFEQEFGKKSAAFDEAWIEREHGYTPDEGVY